MTLAKFNTAVDEASAASIPLVSNIRPEEAGEVTFLLDAPGLDHLRMHLICRDPSLYPERSEFMLFAESDEGMESIADCLERLGSWNARPSVAEAIRLAATEIKRHIKGKVAVTGSLGANIELERNEQGLHRPSAAPAATTAANPLSAALHSDEHFIRETLLAQAAGAKTRLIQYKHKEQLHSILSLSFPASKLGLTKGELQFRGIGLLDHVILLIHLGDNFLAGFNASTLLNKYSAVKFRLGRGKDSELCDTSVKLVFGHYEMGPKSTGSHAWQDKGFEPLYVSNSVDSFLKSDLGKVVSLRRIEQVSWAKAQNHFSNSPTALTPVVDNAGPLRRDYADAGDEDFGSCLIAMQYALWRLVNCNKFCMVCHKALAILVSSTGPFLCGDEFCSFQFMSSQLGPNLEQELRLNLYTVDILVCFFYSAVALSVASDLPLSYGIKLIYMGSNTLAPQHYTGTASLRRNLVRLDLERSDTSKPLKEGDLVVIIPKGEVAWPEKTIHKWHDGSQYIRRIMSIKNNWCKYGSFDAIGQVKEDASMDLGMAGFKPREPSEVVYIFGFWHDVSSLERLELEVALLQTLDCLPTVIEMNVHLRNQPNGTLLSWTRMNYSLVTLLYWIIASHNSALVQDDSVPNTENEDMRLSGRTRISGLHPGYMQFRFVRGSLDFGKGFNSALKQLYPRPLPPSGNCTFFGCNWAPFGEWFNMLKRGLKSTTRVFSTVGGRRQGATFSQRVPITTEQALRQPALIVNDVFRQMFWMKSVLHPAKATALCEIIHTDEELQLPRYIRYAVEDTSLAEPRYLLVKVDPTEEAMRLPLGPRWVPADNETGFAAQMPERQLFRDNGRGDEISIHIPMASLPQAWYRKSMRLVSSPCNEAESGLESVTEPECEPEPGTKRRQRVTARYREHYNNTKRMRINLDYESSTSTYGDEEATDSTSILPPPSWSAFASYTLHRLRREERDLRDIQNWTRIDERGWAICFDELPNPFQWIVEFPYVIGDKSVFLDMHFGPTYPFCPPFVRILKPQLKLKYDIPKMHCLKTGCLCIELLTSSGWNPALPMLSVLTAIRSYLDETIANSVPRQGYYILKEAIRVYPELAKENRWEVPDDFYMIVADRMHVGQTEIKR